MGEADISGEKRVGGFIGKNNYSEVIESWIAVNVRGEQAVGGFVGTDGANTTITTCYWDTERTGQIEEIGADDADVTALRTDEMQGGAAEEQMDGLDFEETWMIQTDPDRYPVFQSTDGAEVETNTG